MFIHQSLPGRSYFVSKETLRDESWVTPIWDMNGHASARRPQDDRLNGFGRPHSQLLMVTREVFDFSQYNYSKLLIELFLADKPDIPIGHVVVSYDSNPARSTYSEFSIYAERNQQNRANATAMGDMALPPLYFWYSIIELEVSPAYNHTHFRLLLLYFVVCEVKANHANYLYLPKPSPALINFYRSCHFMPAPEYADYLTWRTRLISQTHDNAYNLQFRFNMRATIDYWRACLDWLYPDLEQRIKFYFQPASDAQINQLYAQLNRFPPPPVPPLPVRSENHFVSRVMRFLRQFV